LVLVPTVVTGPPDKHAANLTRENFALLKNGRAQPITFFEHVQTTAELMTRPATPPNTFTNTVQANSQRLTIFVLDQLNSSVLEQRTARDQLLKFLSTSTINKEPLCLLALDATGLKGIHDFTTDPAVLAQALQQLSEHGATKDRPVDNPLATTFRMFNGWHSPSETRNIAAAGGRQALLQSSIDSRETSDSLRIRLTLEALRTIGESFTGIPVRKALIWSTGGFPFEIDDRAQFGTREQALLPVYDSTWRAINLANIAVYPLDVEGLQTSALLARRKACRCRNTTISAQPPPIWKDSLPPPAESYAIAAWMPNPASTKPRKIPATTTCLASRKSNCRYQAGLAKTNRKDKPSQARSPRSLRLLHRDSARRRPGHKKSCNSRSFRRSTTLASL
jgi:VWFA-related protein